MLGALVVLRVSLFARQTGGQVVAYRASVGSRYGPDTEARAHVGRGGTGGG